MRPGEHKRLIVYKKNLGNSAVLEEGAKVKFSSLFNVDVMAKKRRRV